MKYRKLSELCEYTSDKILVSILSRQNYISTENMLQNRGGICDAETLPSTFKVSSFVEDDILISNIRPYFKKIWRAKFCGGCSNDILVMRAKQNCNPIFLYYILSGDSFFSYATHTSKGTKMPRGDKKAIMNYQVPDLSYQAQKIIGEFLNVFDRKIELNNKLNDNLQQQAFALFEQLLINAGDVECSVADIAHLNPKRALAKNQEAKCIEMSQLSTSGAFPSGWEKRPFTGGMRFSNGDTLLARITPCLENGKAAFIDFLDTLEVAFGSTEYIVLASKGEVPPEFLYCLARYPAFSDYAVKNMNGSSGRQRVSAETIGQFKLPRPSTNELKRFGNAVSSLFLKMRFNSLENICLSSLRDSLLPKLISGELDVSELDI